MAFENKTIEDVKQLIVSGLEAEFNTKFKLLPKSFVAVMAKVMAAVYMTLYKQQGWIFLQLFVSTASNEEIEIMGRKLRPLTMWGDLSGVGSINNATQYEGKIKVIVKELNSYVYQGTQFLNPLTNQMYYATENVLIDNENNIVPVKCTEAGSIGNLYVNDELLTASPLNNIDRKVTVIETVANANDDESEESYRNRVLSRWRNPPQGGALGDYRQWANEVDGVAQSYVYKDDKSAAGVIIYIKANTEDRIASPELLVKVGESCISDPKTGNGRKPIGAVIDPTNDKSFKNIKVCKILDFDVYIDGYNSLNQDDFKQKIDLELKNYFLGREPFVRGLSLDSERTDNISVFNIISIANDIAEGNNGSFTSVVLKKGDVEIQSYSLGKDELAKLGRLYINGEAL